MYCEAAAKSHFGWHMISGGNAFDSFGMDIFKEKIIEHPFEEIKHTMNDFTRVNFGWWAYLPETQPDIYEFGTSRAAAWNCPATIKINYLENFEKNPRTADILEVIRRWEDVRRRHLLTDEMRTALKNPDVEHTLLINEAGEYELTEYRHLREAAGGTPAVRAFTFTRKGKGCAAIWHSTGSGRLSIPLASDKFVYENELGKADMTVGRTYAFRAVKIDIVKA